MSGTFALDTHLLSLYTAPNCVCENDRLQNYKLCIPYLFWESAI